MADGYVLCVQVVNDAVEGWGLICVCCVFVFDVVGVFDGKFGEGYFSYADEGVTGFEDCSGGIEVSCLAFFFGGFV